MIYGQTWVRHSISIVIGYLRPFWTKIHGQVHFLKTVFDLEICLVSEQTYWSSLCLGLILVSDLVVSEMYLKTGQDHNWCIANLQYMLT